MPRRHTAAVLIALGLAFDAGCAASLPAAAHAHAASSVAVAHVQDRWLLLHLSHPTDAPARQSLVIYVTGDGGWRGKDLETFQHLRGWGQPVAGFSAPDYLDHLRGGAESLSPRALADDFSSIILVAAAQLDLTPAPRVVLVGVSRGADLVVVAAGERTLQPLVEGVVAVALTDEEEFVRRSPWKPGGARASAPVPAPRLEMVKPYECLTEISLPVSLIQSTNDQYVPAASAALWFGPDTPSRRFHPIASRNHSFSDARHTLYRAIRDSIDWVIHASHLAAAGGLS